MNQSEARPDSGVKVAIVPAAGRGTRMRPATHVVPKALLPVVDRPAAQYVVAEAVDAGAELVILVVDPEGGDLISQHFDTRSVERHLDAEIRTVVQEKPLGLGDAIHCARPLVGDEPFMCLLADTIVRPDADLMTPLLNAFDGRSVVALNEVSAEETSRYGIVDVGAWLSPTTATVTGAVEKPGPESAPSRLGIIGRYVFGSGIFDVLANLRPGYGGEIQLTDAIDTLARDGRCLGAIVGPGLLDMGNPMGLLEASTVMGLADDAMRDELLAIIDRERRLH